MANQLLALYSILFNSRNANAIQEQQLDVVENFWYNTKQKLPLPWKVFVDRSQEALQLQMADAAEQNTKLSSWTIFSTLWREFRDSGAFHWCLQALYPFFARTTEHIVDGITARYALLELLGGYVSAMMLPKLRDLPYFQNLANRMEASEDANSKQPLPILPRLFSLAARLSFSAVLFGVLPSAIPSIAFVITMPPAISNSPVRLDIPSVALRLLQTYVAIQQGIFSFVRIHRIQAPSKPEAESSYPQLPIDISTPEARRQIQLVLPVYISDRTLEGLITWGPVIWRELSRIYRIRLHFWPVRRWQRLGMRGSAAIFSTEIATWIYFSRDQKLPA